MPHPPSRKESPLTTAAPATEPDPIPSPFVVRRRRRFMLHLITYAAAMVVLAVLWAVLAVSTGRWVPWPLLVIASWGLVVDAHRRRVYRTP